MGVSMIQLNLEKLYRYPRNQEHMSVAVPVKKGRLHTIEEVSVFDGAKQLPAQCKVTSHYEDGSIRFFFLRFCGNLPANQGHTFQLYLDREDQTTHLKNTQSAASVIDKVIVAETDAGFSVDTGFLQFTVKNYTENIFQSLNSGAQHYQRTDFIGPMLKDGLDNVYEVQIGQWNVIEKGDLCAVLKATGENVTGNGGCEEGSHIRFEVKLTAYAGKSWVDVSYRIINTSEKPLHLASLVFAVRGENGQLDYALSEDAEETRTDSTGCGDIAPEASQDEELFHTSGIAKLPEIQEKIDLTGIRTCAGASNYKTDFLIGRGGREVEKIVSAKKLLMESNEHMAEVFYGTFFADRTTEKGGVCATIFQAQQNYPKAVKASSDGLYVYLIPEKVEKIVMQSGMSREQQFQLYFHEPEISLIEIDNRSLIYQMPDRPVIAPEVFAQSGAVSDVFATRLLDAFEIMLIGKGDSHGRSFGMLNWGDVIDANYTTQGRGEGKAVWSNNEYDYPHACALMYARTGIRRFLDYNIVHARHWMDVDVCHYSSDSNRIGGQIEHTKGHVVNGVMVPSHEWVEGLIDYYHFTGDERGLETAIGIGENVLRLLDTEPYQKAGESNARETGWALRTLVALYTETNDKKWLSKCEWIVGHFKQWQSEYGNWIAPYTDNTLIRTSFMISVAVGSLMRYYRIFQSEELKSLILNAVDDIRENCMLGCGLFYYKELPSLARLGSNTLLLESMAVGYELTGDTKYLESGKRTLMLAMRTSFKNAGGTKMIVEDAMVTTGESTKSFAQSFYPLAVFYKCLVEAGMDEFLKNY